MNISHDVMSVAYTGHNDDGKGWDMKGSSVRGKAGTYFVLALEAFYR